MLHAVIMAGGSGTRFWPASRRDRPKQLLALVSEHTLLRETVDRLDTLIPTSRIWVVTSDAHRERVREILPDLPPAQILGEPCGRDTAACAGWAAVSVRASDPDAVCLVLPADHVITDPDALCAALGAGAAHVSDAGGLLTFGLRPTRPETGFGYLELGEEAGTRSGFAVHHLDRFVEKPDLATADAYLASGRHLWNSGMFAWRAADLLAEIDRQLPLLSQGLAEIAAATGTPHERQVVGEVYPTLPRTSVDFGIMEGAEQGWIVPVDFPWSDIGSWPALSEVLEADLDGNVCRGRVLALDCSDSILVAHDITLASVGLEGMVVVATRDAVLVVPRAQAQKVKDVVDRLSELGWEDVL